MTITVLSKDACVQCTATYRKLDAEGVDYKIEDIYSDENMATITQLGHMRAPVVITRNEQGEIVEHWSGFNPSKISEVASSLKAA